MPSPVALIFPRRQRCRIPVQSRPRLGCAAMWRPWRYADHRRPACSTPRGASEQCRARRCAARGDDITEQSADACVALPSGEPYMCGTCKLYRPDPGLSRDLSPSRAHTHTRYRRTRLSVSHRSHASSDFTHHTVTCTAREVNSGARLDSRVLVASRHDQRRRATRATAVATVAAATRPTSSGRSISFGGGGGVLSYASGSSTKVATSFA